MFIDLKNKKKLNEFLLKKNKLLKNLNKKDYENKFSLKILGGYTTNELSDWCKIFASNSSLNLNIVNSYWGPAFIEIQKILLDQTDLLSFDGYLILNTWRDLLNFSNLNDTIITEETFNNHIKNFLNLCKKNKKFVIISLFDIPKTDIYLKNLNCRIDKILYNINNSLILLSKTFQNLTLIDLQHETLKEKFDWDDPRDWYSFGSIFSQESCLISGNLISKKICHLYQHSKKILFIDLDNTIWDGVIGDDGLENIRYTPETSQGRIFYDIQCYIKYLKENGILIAIVSKNEEKIALSALKSENMILNIEDFVEYKINWKPKSTNIIEVLDKLNLQSDSAVFFDDNPVERYEVKNNVPGILVPELNTGPEEFIDTLNRYDYFFNIDNGTDEDLRKTEMYKNNKARDRHEKSFKNHEDFIKSLNVEIIMRSPTDNDKSRVLQLTNKTNQFNFTTKRMSILDINNYYDSKNKLIYIIRVSDIFGDYGIVGIIYITKDGSDFVIDNWILSCRIFGKTIEDAFIGKVITRLKKLNCKKIILDYKGTTKNKIIENLPRNFNFKKHESLNNTWVLDLTKDNFNYNGKCKIIYEE